MNESFLFVGGLSGNDGAASGMGTSYHGNALCCRFCQCFFIFPMDAAVSRTCIDDAFGAHGNSGFHHGAVGAGVAVDDVDFRKSGKPLHIKGSPPFGHMHRQGAPAWNAVIHIA